MILEWTRSTRFFQVEGLFRASAWVLGAPSYLVGVLNSQEDFDLGPLTIGSGRLELEGDQDWCDRLVPYRVRRSEWPGPSSIRSFRLGPAHATVYIDKEESVNVTWHIGRVSFDVWVPRDRVQVKRSAPGTLIDLVERLYYDIEWAWNVIVNRVTVRMAWEEILLGLILGQVPPHWEEGLFLSGGYYGNLREVATMVALGELAHED